MLEVKDLVVRIDDKKVISGLNLKLDQGVSFIMGPNGSGKSSLLHVISGDPKYNVLSGEIEFQGKNIKDLQAYERARDGIFLAYQNPVAIPGVEVFTMLRKSYELVKGKSVDVVEFKNRLVKLLGDVGLDPQTYKRYVNDGFSGGEKKRLELAQMLLLEPKLVLLDEIDSGLDIDSLKIVGDSVSMLRKKGASVVVVTHYGRIGEYIEADKVYVLKSGKIVEGGDKNLISRIESEGYEKR